MSESLTTGVSSTIPRIDDQAQAFTAITTQGLIEFPSDYAGTAKERMDGVEDGIDCVDWFFCTKELPLETIQERLHT